MSNTKKNNSKVQSKLLNSIISLFHTKVMIN
jgi:hypothetical protein